VRLADGHADPGDYEAVWVGVRADGRRMPPGVYVVRLRHDGHVVSGAKVVIER
jgi:hypothetical protein